MREDFVLGEALVGLNQYGVVGKMAMRGEVTWRLAEESKSFFRAHEFVLSITDYLSSGFLILFNIQIEHCSYKTRLSIIQRSKKMKH
jgi:hypothetical protein